MPLLSDLPDAVLRYRADALVAVVLTGVACGVYRSALRRRNAAGEAFRWAPFVAIAGVVIGALLAEGLYALLRHPAPVTAPVILVARGLVLGAATALGTAGLIGAVRIAGLRGELRQHADAGRQLQQAKLDADEANRAKSDFLAMMSHEIRTPLNAVMGFANLLADSPLDEVQRGYVTTITTEGARLGSLINDILDLTKIEKGRLQLERLPFAPAETVQEVLRLLSPRAAEKRIELRFEAQLAGPLLIAGDPLRFRQVIVNLVDNAIKFTPCGSVTVFMAWNMPADAGQAGQLAIRVRDTGIGLAPDKLKNLFQMFMQADTSTTRRYGGSGLGLAICQRLVGLMGGEITVRSTPGEGSEFAFTLPFAPLPLPGEQAVATDATPPFARPPRILVVDDMETNRFLLEVFLRRHGFEPQLAAGGEEAIRLAAENRYDAILMDLQMPGMDGYTVTRRIRAAEPPGRRTPIIALTASMARDTREKCLEAGMDEHLTKPLDLPKFRTVLNSFLRRSVEAAPFAPASSTMGRQ